MQLIIQNNRIAAASQRFKNSSVRIAASRTNCSKDACMAGGIFSMGQVLDSAMHPSAVLDQTILGI